MFEIHSIALLVFTNGIYGGVVQCCGKVNLLPTKTLADSSCKSFDEPLLHCNYNDDRRNQCHDR